MSEANTKMHPLILTAAAAVILASAVAVGVMTGVIPTSKTSKEAITAAENKTAPAPAPEVKAAPAAVSEAKVEPKVKVAPAPVHKTAPQVAQKHTPEPAPKPQERVVVNAPPPPVPAPAPAPARVCSECGVIALIDVVDVKGAGSGLGAVGGAVLGGLLGNQVGAGRGNTVATVVGAAGGALAGNEVEKRAKATKEYHVSVRMDDGNTHRFTFDSAPAFVVGDKVKVIDGKLVRG